MATITQSYTAGTTTSATQVQLQTGSSAPSSSVVVTSPRASTSSDCLSPSNIPSSWGNVIGQDVDQDISQDVNQDVNQDEVDTAWLEGYSQAQQEKARGISLNLSQAQLKATYGSSSTTEAQASAWMEGYTQAVNVEMKGLEDVDLGSLEEGKAGVQPFDGVEEGGKGAVAKVSWERRHVVALAIGAGVGLLALSGGVSALVLLLPGGAAL